MKWILFLSLSLFLISCNWYRFNDVSVDPKLKTFKVIYIENKARYINPQLTPKITDKLRQKIIAQTKLSPATGDADLEISGYINEYSFTTSGLATGSGASTNRLNIGLSIEIKNNQDPDKTIQANITRNYDFAANLSTSQAEAKLSDEIIKNVVDEIFNKIFSNW